MKFKGALILLIGIGLFMASCAYGPKRENDKAVDLLNGENYQQRSNILGVPVFERQRAVVKISGRVLLKQDAVPAPVINQTLILKKDEKEVLKTLTTSQGEFKFVGSLANGTYQIQLASDRYKSEQEVVVDKYEIKDIQMTAYPATF